MKTKDSIKYASTTTFREKKNFYFVIILMICTVVLIGTLTFKKLFFESLNNSFENDVIYRKLIVAPSNKEYTEHGPNYDYHYEKIYNIKHVQEIYNMNYDLVDQISKTFVTTEKNGYVELLFGTKNTIPKDIIGERLDMQDTGVAICAKNFYPSIKPDEKIDSKTKFLDGESLIGSKFIIERPIYERVGGKLKESEEIYSKEYRIIGTFDTAKTGELTSSCYISGKDMKELYDTTSSVLNVDSMAPEIVVIDNRDNLDYVITEISKLGFRVETQVTINHSLISNMRVICFLIMLVVIAVISLLTMSYVKKKNLDDSFEIGLLKSIGYKRGDILKISFYQMVCLVILSILCGTIIFESIYVGITIIFKNYIIYNNYIVKQFVSPFVVTIVIISILPTLINYFYTKNKIKNSSITLLRGDNL